MEFEPGDEVKDVPDADEGEGHYPRLISNLRLSEEDVALI